MRLGSVTTGSEGFARNCAFLAWPGARPGGRRRPSPSTACQQASAASAAVSDRSTRGPRPTGVTNGSLPRASSSLWARPPSGPVMTAQGAARPSSPAARPESASAMGRAAPDSAQSSSRRPAGQPSTNAPRSKGSRTSGTLRRPHCSAASRALAARRSQLTRPTTVCRVITGCSTAQPSSVAFSARKPMRARLIGAKTSQRSGSGSGARRRASTTSAHQPLPRPSIRASHSPSRALNAARRAPAPRRSTEPRKGARAGSRRSAAPGPSSPAT